MDMALAAGATGLEVLFNDERSLGELKDLERAGQIADAARQRGVLLPSVALMLLTETDGLIRQSERTEQALQIVRSAMYGAVELGADLVVLPMIRRSEIVLPEHYTFFADRLENLSEEADAIGVTLVIRSPLPLDQKMALIDHAGGIGVRHSVDPSLVHLRKLDPATEIRNLGRDRIGQIALRDAKLQENEPPVVDLPLGDGQVDLRAVGRSLKAIGFDGWLCVDSVPTEDPAETAAANVRFALDLLQ